jgi:hypothetical protein
MANISTTTEGQRISSQLFKDSCAFVNQRNDRMYGVLNSIPWVGETQQIFTQAMTDWRTQMKVVTDRLDYMADILLDNATVIDNAESSGSASAGSIL